MFGLNNKGFGKFEVLTVLVLIIVVIAFLLYTILGGADAKKFDNMRSDAIQFNKAVYPNLDSYFNQRIVYMEEVVDQRLLDRMKSPFSADNCDYTQSKVVTEGDKTRFTTMKCDSYLIDNDRLTSKDSISIYKVGEWSSKKISGKNVEKKELYNCEENGSMLLEEYVEPEYLVFKTNKLYSLSNYSINDLPEDICKIVKKDFYRTKELVEEKKES